MKACSQYKNVKIIRVLFLFVFIGFLVFFVGPNARWPKFRQDAIQESKHLELLYRSCFQIIDEQIRIEPQVQLSFPDCIKHVDLLFLGLSKNAHLFEVKDLMNSEPMTLLCESYHESPKGKLVLYRSGAIAYRDKSGRISKLE